MNTKSNSLKRLMILALSACALGLAGCGEDDDNKSSSSNSGGGGSVGGFLFCVAVVLTSGDDSCATNAVSGSGGSGSSGSSGSTGSGDSTSTSSNNTVHFERAWEYEPNNDLINANVPLFPTRSNYDDKTGWYLEGKVDDVNDTRDAFALTPRRAFRYRIELCPPGHGSCIPDIGMDPLTIFWRLFDHDGNEITSSQAASSNRQYVNLEAGLMYYVVVDAGDTMGTRVGYRLYVHEL